MLVSAHLWQPTVLTTEFAGPLTIAEPGQPPTISANWRHAQTKLHGLPTSPESVSIEIERAGGRSRRGREPVQGGPLDLNGRLVSGTVQDNPVIEIVLKLAAASAPSWHPAAATPVDADITAVLRGLKDFAPKPWPAALSRIAGGRRPHRDHERAACSRATPSRSPTARSACRRPAGSTASFA